MFIVHCSDSLSVSLYMYVFIHTFVHSLSLVYVVVFVVASLCICKDERWKRSKNRNTNKQKSKVSPKKWQAWMPLRSGCYDRTLLHFIVNGLRRGHIPRRRDQDVWDSIVGKGSVRSCRFAVVVVVIAVLVVIDKEVSFVGI